MITSLSLYIISIAPFMPTYEPFLSNPTSTLSRLTTSPQTHSQLHNPRPQPTRCRHHPAANTTIILINQHYRHHQHSQHPKPVTVSGPMCPWSFLIPPLQSKLPCPYRQADTDVPTTTTEPL
ncbi:hypothetical protein M6B38_354790 [Iris pallida]|uniref:Uncharacterized protein n=1 Tax=Iris pallida TaxID=29817 RepID=A0AAX6GNZ3_IRIPA|nr:hypothetical protein M6B38_354790 [Iris pallida]